MKDWKNRLGGQSWLDKSEQKLVEDFISKLLGTTEPPGDLRIHKYITDLKEGHESTKQSLSVMIHDLASLKQAVEKINRTTKYASATKKDVKKILARLYSFFHNKEPSLKYASPELRRVVEHKMEDKRKEALDTINWDEVHEMLLYCD